MIKPVHHPTLPVSETQQRIQLETLLAQIPIARITEQIRLLWGTIEGDGYLNALLINDREGKRAGFAPEVSHAIFTLITLNEQVQHRSDAKPESDTIKIPDWTSAASQWKYDESRELKAG